MKIGKIENISRPGIEPLDGDLIEIVPHARAKVRKIYHTPVEPEPMPVQKTAKEKAKEFLADKPQATSDEKIKAICIALEIE